MGLSSLGEPTKWWCSFWFRVENHKRRAPSTKDTPHVPFDPGLRNLLLINMWCPTLKGILRFGGSLWPQKSAVSGTRHVPRPRLGSQKHAHRALRATCCSLHRTAINRPPDRPTEQASKQASKQASNQASKQPTNQARNQGSASLLPSKPQVSSTIWFHSHAFISLPPAVGSLSRIGSRPPSPMDRLHALHVCGCRIGARSQQQAG